MGNNRERPRVHDENDVVSDIPRGRKRLFFGINFKEGEVEPRGGLVAVVTADSPERHVMRQNRLESGGVFR